MKIIATVSSSGHDVKYVAEISSNEITALACNPDDANVVINRKGQKYTINANSLSPDDELDCYKLREFARRARNVNENRDTIRRTISQLRGALTKLEKATEEGEES